MCAPASMEDSPSKLQSPPKMKASTYKTVLVLLAVAVSLVFLLGVDAKGVFASQEMQFTIPGKDTTSGSIKPKKERGKFLEEGSDKSVATSMFKAYKEIQLEYHKKAFAASANQWKLLNVKDGVSVSLMEVAADPTCPYVKLEAVFPSPVDECWDFLRLSNWDRNMPKMDPFYEGVSLHGEYNVKGVNMILARKRTKRILAFSKRDFVFLSVADQPLADGTWVSGTVSVVTPPLPRATGYTRAFQDSVAFYKPIEDGQHTQLTIICRLDLNDSSEDGNGGSIPMWLYVKTIGVTGANSVIGMRDAMMKAKQEGEVKGTYMTKKRIGVLSGFRNIGKRAGDNVVGVWKRSTRLVGDVVKNGKKK